VLTDDSQLCSPSEAPWDQCVFPFASARFSINLLQDLENWIENLHASHLVPYPHYKNASVHSGFYDAFRSIQDQIFPVLTEQLSLYPNAELALTGHSLGGALATIALAQIVFELDATVPNNMSLYTFGSPRVGDTVNHALH
jgi:predicted lipase